MKTVQKLLCMQTWVYNHEWSQRIVLNENNAFTVVSKDASLSEVRHTSHTNLWLNKGEWKTERILKNMDLFRLKEGRTLSTLCVFGLRVAESHHLLFYTVFDIEQPPFAHLGAIVAVRCSDGPLHNSAGQKKKKNKFKNQEQYRNQQGALERPKPPLCCELTLDKCLFKWCMYLWGAFWQIAVFCTRTCFSLSFRPLQPYTFA